MGQMIRYGLVGVLNTLITAAVIYLCQEIMGLSPVVSNVLGYAAGVINSFIFNSRWTFKAALSWWKFVGFVLAFGVCYLLQLLVLVWLGESTDIPPYPRQLIAMAVYTVVNFLVNKLAVFRR